MIVAAAFCPNPPALLPALAQGADGERAQLRAAAVEAVRAVAGHARQVLVLGAAARREHFPPGATGSMAGFGTDLRITLGAAHGTPREGMTSSTPVLPLSLTIAAWLLSEAVGAEVRAHAWSVPHAAAVPAALVEEVLAHTGTDCALLVMGDGSARRSLSAPGYLDDRAAPFDASVAAALASGDPRALAGLDAVLGASLLASGVPAWHAAAAVLGSGTPPGGRFDASVAHDAAPFGVGYFVATWSRADRPAP